MDGGHACFASCFQIPLDTCVRYEIAVLDGTMEVHGKGRVA